MLSPLKVVLSLRQGQLQKFRTMVADSPKLTESRIPAHDESSRTTVKCVISTVIFTYLKVAFFPLWIPYVLVTGIQRRFKSTLSDEPSGVEDHRRTDNVGFIDLSTRVVSAVIDLMRYLPIIGHVFSLVERLLLFVLWMMSLFSPASVVNVGRNLVACMDVIITYGLFFVILCFVVVSNSLKGIMRKFKAVIFDDNAVTGSLLVIFASSAGRCTEIVFRGYSYLVTTIVTPFRVGTFKLAANIVALYRSCCRSIVTIFRGALRMVNLNPVSSDSHDEPRNTLADVDSNVNADPTVTDHQTLGALLRRVRALEVQREEDSELILTTLAKIEIFASRMSGGILGVAAAGDGNDEPPDSPPNLDNVGPSMLAYNESFD